MVLKPKHGTAICFRIATSLLSSDPFRARITKLHNDSRVYTEDMEVLDLCNDSDSTTYDVSTLTDEIHAIIDDFSLADNRDVNQLKIASSILEYIIINWTPLFDPLTDHDKLILQYLIVQMKTVISFNDDMLTLQIKAPLISDGEFNILKNIINRKQVLFVSKQSHIPDKTKQDIEKRRLKYMKKTKLKELNELDTKVLLLYDRDYYRDGLCLPSKDDIEKRSDLKSGLEEVNIFRNYPERGAKFDEDMIILKFYRKHNHYRNLAEKDYSIHKLYDYILDRDKKPPSFNPDNTTRTFGDLATEYISMEEIRNSGSITIRETIKALEPDQFNKRIDEIKMYHYYPF